MKKKLIILLSILLLCSCTSKEPQTEEVPKVDKKLYETPEELIIEQNKTEFELFTNVSSSELIGNTNATITSEDTILDTLSPGEHTYTVDLEYNNKKYKHDFKYTVKDVTPPFVLTYNKTAYTTLGTVPNPCSSANFVDDYDDEPFCEIVGDYDVFQDGDYKVQYRFYDSSNNETLRDLTIKVIEEMPTFPKTTKAPTPKTKTYIKDVISKYKTKDTMIGIDVSRYQGDIDFNKVKASGVEFVIMRLGIQSNINKDISVDTKYYQNIKNAKEAGLKVGVYVFTTATNSAKAKEHAEWTLNILNGEELDFPIAYDWENWNKFGSYKTSIFHLSDGFDAFYDTVNKQGYTAMLYSSKRYLEKVWMNRFDRPVWLAHYTSNLNKSSYEGKYIMWQLCSNGRVDGIKGNVDLDIYYKEKEE